MAEIIHLWPKSDDVAIPELITDWLSSQPNTSWQAFGDEAGNFIGIVRKDALAQYMQLVAAGKLPPP